MRKTPRFKTVFAVREGICQYELPGSSKLGLPETRDAMVPYGMHSSTPSRGSLTPWQALPPTTKPSREGRVSRRLNQSPSKAPEDLFSEGCLVPLSGARFPAGGVQAENNECSVSASGRRLLQPSRSVLRFWRCGSRGQRCLAFSPVAWTKERLSVPASLSPVA